MAWRFLYMPLVDAPDLFLEFAALADREITQDVWLEWIHHNGVLGLDRPVARHAKARTRGGNGETLSRFVEEARTANKALRLYEAATRPYGPDQIAIERYMPTYSREHVGDTAESVKAWALDEVAAIVQRNLATECFPQLYRLPDGDSFAYAPDFKSLLGAMYLHMMFLMTATGDVRRCKAPGCSRIITFEQPEESPEQRIERLSEGRRRPYKTRSDKLYCGKACYQRWRYWNNKLRKRQAGHDQ
jgi:hypothetical protein